MLRAWLQEVRHECRDAQVSAQLSGRLPRFTANTRSDLSFELIGEAGVATQVHRLE